jgi:hypothetical protein
MRSDLSEVDVETVSEQQRRARREVRLDRFLVDRSLVLIGNQERDEIGTRRRLVERCDAKAVAFGRVPRPGVLP